MRSPVATTLLVSLAFVLVQSLKPTFEVDYTHDTFVKDGKPFKYVSGELHYFRIPRINWLDRMQKIKLLGFDTISTFVEWSLHEPQPGQYNFAGEADLVYYIKAAKLAGLNVILRPGPFIDAQRDFGGLPSWIMSENSKMKVRTSDASYTFLVKKWYDALFTHITPLLYGNGGPIIMVQVENDYGNNLFHDPNYLQWLADLTQSHVQNNAVLFTADTYNGLRRGKIPNVLSTLIDSPVLQNITALTEILREVQPHGPLVYSQLPTAEPTYWGEKRALQNSTIVSSAIESMLLNNFNFNCYMIAGGTNFGFTAGCDGANYTIATTSFYDDAPISEAGDLTDKYMAVWAMMKKHKKPAGRIENIDRLRNVPKGDFGASTLNPAVSLLDSPIGKPISTPWPLAMETFHQSGGFIAYSHVIPSQIKTTSYLHVKSSGRATVFVNGDKVGIIGTDDAIAIPPQTTPTANITILVENVGRQDTQLIDVPSKGILSDVKLDGVVLQDWQTVSYTLPPEDIFKIETMPGYPPSSVKLPAFYVGTAIVSYPFDTYLDMSGWGKGVAFVNGHNLGRYWGIGPQYTLYVPAIYLHPYPTINLVTILELESAGPYNTVQFIPKSKFDTQQ